MISSEEGLLSAEQASDLAACRRRQCYVNGVHRMFLLPVLYVVGVHVAPIGHPHDLTHRTQTGEVL